MNSEKLNLYINEPDIYAGINFDLYPCFGEVIQGSDNSFDPKKIDALLVGLRDVIDDEFLMPFTRLKYILSNTTGIDHVKTTRNIQLIKLDPREVEAVSATAEFTLALLLSLVRKIPFIDPEKVGDRQLYRGNQLGGKNIGIFGLGRLGRKMARYAEALEMNVTSYDRDSTPEDKKRLLVMSDIITIHLPLNEETTNFIDEQDFEFMKKRPFIVNTSRPQIICKEALIKALDSDRIAGLAMDFINYDASDRWDEDLKGYAGGKLLLTPHIAGNTHESIAYTANVVVQKLIGSLR